MGTVYVDLGSKVVVIEAFDTLLAGADADLVRPVQKYAEKHFKELRFKTKVTKMATRGRRSKVSVKRARQETEELFDKVLVAVGRVANSAWVWRIPKWRRMKEGFVKVNDRQETSDPNIMAIGIAGGVMLAHKASRKRGWQWKCSVESTTKADVIIPRWFSPSLKSHSCGLTRKPKQKAKKYL